MTWFFQLAKDRQKATDRILEQLFPAAFNYKKAITGGKPALFKVGLKAIAPSLSLLFNDTKALKGAVLEIGTTNGSYNIAVDKTFRVQEMLDLGALVRQCSTEQYCVPVAHKKIDIFQFLSDKSFIVIPFVCLQENGEALTATDGTGANVNTVVGTAVGAQTCNVAFGEAAASKFQNDASYRHTVSMGIDLTNLFNAYAMHYRRKLLVEENYLELRIGFVFAGQASSTIYFHKQASTIYHQVDQDSLPRELIGA